MQNGLPASSSAPTRRPRSLSARWARRDGFTILEVAMAAFIMAFGIATSVLAMQNGFRHLDLARGTTLASQIIQSEMERLRLMSWTGISALPATETFDGATFFSASADVAGRFTVTRTRTADSARPTEAMNLSVSVTWSTYDGRSHTRTFTSIYAKNGLYDYYYTIAHP